MSDNIPFDIQEEIMKRLPVKSLIQFRSVSKPWMSLIDSSRFIKFHHTHQQQHHLFLRFKEPKGYEFKYVSILYDINYDTFPQLTLPVPVSIKPIKNPVIRCSSQFGLLCFYDFHGMPYDSSTKKAVIWNPYIRKSVDVYVPNVLDRLYVTVIGFGVCPRTCDPKILRISYLRKNDVNITNVSWLVEIFTLSSGVWRSPLCSNLPRKSIHFLYDPVDVDRFIYWLACDKYTVNGELHRCNLIMSFDMTSEEFTPLCLPDSLAHNPRINISKQRESLVVLEYVYEDYKKRVWNVWKMKHGVTKSFTKLFTIKMTDASITNVHGFTMNSALVIEMKNKKNGHLGDLFVYKPNSKKMHYTGVSGNICTFSTRSYMESLLLLDH